jgi:hypothetical protein
VNCIQINVYNMCGRALCHKLEMKLLESQPKMLVDDVQLAVKQITAVAKTGDGGCVPYTISSSTN